jgi:hypothetical protein
MKPHLKIPPTIVAVLGSLFSMRGAYLLYTLELTETETLLARAFGALILGCFLVAMGYIQSLPRPRKDSSPSCGSEE